MAVKRIIDLIVALLGLVVLSPLILLLAVLTAVTSPGPMIFRQARVGRHERPFVCLKFRTMRTGTPHLGTHETPVSAITPLGRHLRRRGLDELPQLWNVAKGEMSLVGPRPCLNNQNEVIEQRRLHNVFCVAPGITGLAQINDIDMSDPVALAEIDAEYIRTCSIPGDFQIILRTFNTVRNTKTQ